MLMEICDLGGQNLHKINLKNEQHVLFNNIQVMHLTDKMKMDKEH
jgi:hypothetical protein